MERTVLDSHSRAVVERKGREGKEAGREVVQDGSPREQRGEQSSIGGHQGKGWPAIKETIDRHSHWAPAKKAY